MSPAATGWLFFFALLALTLGAVWFFTRPTPPVPLTAEEQIFGRKPSVVDLGPGRVVSVAVYSYLRDNLKDPESLEIIASSAPITKDLGAEKGWFIAVEYRAKNSFGGYVVARAGALIRDERVVIWQKGE